MPMATSNQKWSHSCPESHILAWWFTKRQVGMPDECLLLRVFGNCCKDRSFSETLFDLSGRELHFSTGTYAYSKEQIENIQVEQIALQFRSNTQEMAVLHFID